MESPTLTESDIARFWAKVDKSGDCWTWTAGKTSRGYGAFHLGASKIVGAHRISFIIKNGEIDGSVHVDHLCFNHACVNPDHLRGLTPGGNSEHRSGAQTNSSTGVRGVTYRARIRRFEATAKKSGRTYYAGSFKTLAEAEAAAVALRLKLFPCSDVDRVHASVA